MNNRERVLAALHFQKPDTVPYCVYFTSSMQEKLEAHPGWQEYARKMDNHITAVDLSLGFQEVRPGYFRDEYGVVWNRSGVDKDIGVVDHYQLQDPSDLAGFELPTVDETRIRQNLEWLISTPRSNFRLANIGFSLFERAWTLRGMENLLCDMLEEPEFVHGLMEKITIRNLQLIDIALEYDIDAFLFGDDWGQQRGLIMGPVCWRTFIKPYLAQMYARAHKKGKYVFQHSCGDIRLIMEDLYDIGLNAYQTFQPEIYGYDYAQKLFGKIAIWGGISTQQDLPSKTPAEVAAVTRNLLAAFPHGGLIAAPTHSVPGDVPPENIISMMDVLLHQ